MTTHALGNISYTDFSFNFQQKIKKNSSIEVLVRCVQTLWLRREKPQTRARTHTNIRMNKYAFFLFENIRFTNKSWQTFVNIFFYRFIGMTCVQKITWNIKTFVAFQVIWLVIENFPILIFSQPNNSLDGNSFTPLQNSINKPELKYLTCELFHNNHCKFRDSDVIYI